MQVEIALQLRNLRKLVPTRHVEILREMLTSGEDQTETAKQQGLVRQRISQIYKTCVERLQQYDSGTFQESAQMRRARRTRV